MSLTCPICIYICIWNYYKYSFVMWWEKIPLLHVQMLSSYYHMIQISNRLPPPFPSFHPSLLPVATLAWQFSFGMLFWVPSDSLVAILFCFKAAYHSDQTKVCVQDHIISAMPTTITTSTTSSIWQHFCLYCYVLSKNFLSVATSASIWPSQVKGWCGHRMTGNLILHGM
jgi:hypothetical protein